MTDRHKAEQAERLSEKRTKALPVLALLFATQQITFFTAGGSGMRTVDHIQTGAWLILSIVLLLVLATGGGWIYPREVRDLANDESTRAHRADAFRMAFLVTMTAAIALYVVDLFKPMGGREAIHLIMTIGIATALLRYGLLERRAQPLG